MTSRNYSATASATTLGAGITASATSIQVAATTGFPAAPFLLALDYGTASQELVLVTAVAGTTLTVTRAYDSTTGVTHSLGAVVKHVHSAIDFRDSRTHENASSGVHGATGAVVGTTDAQALSNKDLSAGTNTFPTSLATLTGAQALTNKDLSSATNTLPATVVQTTDPTTGIRVKCATTANITLSGTQTIDTIAVVAGDLVLVKNQTTASQNGVYTVAAGAWARSTGFNSSTKIAGAIVSVLSGAQGGTDWNTTFKSTDTLDTTAMTWAQLVDTSSAQTLTGKTVSLASNTVSGTTAQFNTALTDNDFATLAGAETLTNKTLSTGTKVGAATTDISGAWATYAPTPTNFTAGNGTLTGRYMQMGKTVHVVIYFAAGSTSTYSSSGFAITLPFAAANTFEQMLNLKIYRGSTAGTVLAGFGYVPAAATQVFPYTPTGSGSLLGGMSGAAGAGLCPDSSGAGNFVIQGTYEVA